MPVDRPDDFGSKLRQARERKGVSLRQIANRTKIAVAVLDALERNDVSRLPGGIFSRAFVRSYAAEVGLDPESTVQEFIAQFPHESGAVSASPVDRVEDTERFESERRMASTVLWMLIVSIPLAGIVLYFGFASRREAAPASTESAAAPPAAPVEQPRDVPPPVGSATPRTPEPGTAPASTVGAVQSPAPSSPAGAQPAAIDREPDRLTVGLSARSPVFVQATADGRIVMDRLLQKGERQVIEVKRELVLTAGDASAVSLTLNGAAGRPLGKAGEVVRTRLTPGNFKDYLLVR